MSKVDRLQEKEDTKLLEDDNELLDDDYVSGKIDRQYGRRQIPQLQWFYRDRESKPRGPLTIHDMRSCWVKGVIDEHTIVFADGYEEWAPVNKVQELEWCIKTPEVRVLTLVERVRQRAMGLNVPGRVERAASVASQQWKNGIVPPVFPTPAWERMQRKKAERKAAAKAAKEQAQVAEAAEAAPVAA
uniref:GYF domain-containing protein n=2 Tax=Viridiplantae TaxID=33090 RepID=A0A7R9TEZ7_9VIRI|mmetsp:Transcript_13741/g.57420  ORF Transcript_13741/g.57420 Transcript_13741/m.57420 type:complete len:187 (+) Transcript_13741:237-797(+)